MIEAFGLSKRYGAKLAVDDLSFTVRPGTVTGFLGPNGSGKSTTMRLLLGLGRPSAGSALVNGQHYRDLKPMGWSVADDARNAADECVVSSVVGNLRCNPRSLVRRAITGTARFRVGRMRRVRSQESWAYGEPQVALLRLHHVGMGEGSRVSQAADLFDMLYAPLAGWAAAALGDEEAGHDVAAEAFTRLFARLSSVRSPRPFLYAVAANLIRDRWRAQAHDRALLSLLEQQQPQVWPAPDVSVRDIVERLPERLRLPVLLHYYADLPVAEAARVLHRPVGSVKRALSEARAALAPLLLETSDER